MVAVPPPQRSLAATNCLTAPAAVGLRAIRSATSASVNWPSPARTDAAISVRSMMSRWALLPPTRWAPERMSTSRSTVRSGTGAPGSLTGGPGLLPGGAGRSPSQPTTAGTRHIALGRAAACTRMPGTAVVSQRWPRPATVTDRCRGCSRPRRWPSPDRGGRAAPSGGGGDIGPVDCPTDEYRTWARCS